MRILGLRTGRRGASVSRRGLPIRHPSERDLDGLKCGPYGARFSRMLTSRSKSGSSAARDGMGRTLPRYFLEAAR